MNTRKEIREQEVEEFFQRERDERTPRYPKKERSQNK